MPDPVMSGCNRMPPTNISGNPLPNTMEEIVIYGCVPRGRIKEKPVTVSQARAEIQRRCRALKLTGSTTKALLTSLGLQKNHAKPAGARARQGLGMLETLEKAVRNNPRLPGTEREQFAILWTKLGARSGARGAFTTLGQNQHFWGRLSGKNRRVVAYHLANLRCSPKSLAKDFTQIMSHHLFATANQAGKHNALADPLDSVKLLNANTLPDRASLKKQAPALMTKHIGHMKPASRAIMHQQIMTKARYLGAAFFEHKPGSKSNKLWGDRFVNARGRDWYKQSLNMILRLSARNACLSAFNTSGARKGADVICGND